MAESTDTTTSLPPEETQNEPSEDRGLDALEAMTAAFVDIKQEIEADRQLKKDDPEAYHQMILDAADWLAKRATPWKEGELQKGLIITNMLPPPSSQDT